MMAAKIHCLLPPKAFSQYSINNVFLSWILLLVLMFCGDSVEAWSTVTNSCIKNQPRRILTSAINRKDKNTRIPTRGAASTILSASTTTSSSSTAKEDTTIQGTTPTPTPTNTNTNTHRRGLEVASEIHLPFPMELAYDTFADVTRQPEWSPWLHSVEWIEEESDNEHTIQSKSSKWTLQVLGVRYSWISIATTEDRPQVIEWESTSGLKNFGRVHIQPRVGPHGEEQSFLSMSMTFVPPRLVAAVFRNTKALSRFMEQKMLKSSLEMFRDTVVETTIPSQNMTILFPM